MIPSFMAITTFVFPSLVSRVEGCCRVAPESLLGYNWEEVRHGSLLHRLYSSIFCHFPVHFSPFGMSKPSVVTHSGIFSLDFSWFLPFTKKVGPVE